MTNEHVDRPEAKSLLVRALVSFCMAVVVPARLLYGGGRSQLRGFRFVVVTIAFLYLWLLVSLPPALYRIARADEGARAGAALAGAFAATGHYLLPFWLAVMMAVRRPIVADEPAPGEGASDAAAIPHR